MMKPTMKRRQFLSSTTLGGLSLSLLAQHGFAQDDSARQTSTEFDRLTKSLLVQWCDGMIAHQVDMPNDPTKHGGIDCPASKRIHGRCSDALYPFLHMAHVTGEQKYLDAAIRVYDWAEHNVSRADGSWTNDVNPKSWRGTTIFGAIALAEALHYHGEVLDKARRDAWMARLDKAVSGYLWSDFKKINFTNLNYGMTAVYGFHLFGELLENQEYTKRSEQFAGRVKEFFTKPNHLLWGEGKPNDLRSGRGLLPVDLGYNVEESLNGVVLYAVDVNDTELLDLMTKALAGHLEFMLPDGAWDNSWGTRSQKWSYWGSRTSDGCQPAFSLMADRNPAFGTAAIRNAELMQRCTADGLLHGGPHYVSHGIKPFMHHTFTHAKVMALVQDRMKSMPSVNSETPLPRQIANGVKHFPELDVWLAAKGPWRATVSAYDFIYKTKKSGLLQQPTGGSLAVLYHDKVGTLLASSMARYEMVEPLNMQPQPGPDFPLTPRVELRTEDDWFTNLYDLKANVSFTEDEQRCEFEVQATLQNEERETHADHETAVNLRYTFTRDKVSISVTPPADAKAETTLVVPLIAPSGETVRQVSDNRIEIEKPGGIVVLTSNVPLALTTEPEKRVFNMVPGMESVPVTMKVGNTPKPVVCEISVVA